MPLGKIPLDVEGNGGSDAGERLHLRCIGKFLFEGGSGAGLQKLPETGAGVGETP